jgi:hypothetical protein
MSNKFAMTAPVGKPITNGKVEGRVPLESLFDEVENDGGSPKYNDEEAKKKHPSVKKIGSWESEGTSIYTATGSTPAYLCI